MAAKKNGVKITLNYANIAKLKARVPKALAKTVEQMHTDVVQSGVMPRDTGFMEDTSTFVDLSQQSENKVALVTSTPYARRLYFHPEYNFSTTENANAQGKWLQPYVDGEKRKLLDLWFAQFMK